jgi:hypothetical protein
LQESVPQIFRKRCIKNKLNDTNKKLKPQDKKRCFNTDALQVTHPAELCAAPAPSRNWDGKPGLGKFQKLD